MSIREEAERLRKLSIITGVLFFASMLLIFLITLNPLASAIYLPVMLISGPAVIIADKADVRGAFYAISFGLLISSLACLFILGGLYFLTK